jgi:hypothetical protein
VTNAPTPFFTGQIEATVGEAALREGGFAVGGPLLSSNPRELMFRLAVHQHTSDGFRHNVTRNQDTNARDEWSDRLRVTWNPSADWRWEGAFLHSELRNGFDEFALERQRPPDLQRPAGARCPAFARGQRPRRLLRRQGCAVYDGDERFLGEIPLQLRR